jgi:hypothetical protein
LTPANPAGLRIISGQNEIRLDWRADGAVTHSILQVSPTADFSFYEENFVPQDPDGRFYHREPIETSMRFYRLFFP